MPKNYLHVNDFSKGQNNVKNPRDLDTGELAQIENFNVSKNGELVPRGAFANETDGSAHNTGSQDVDLLTASLNAGYGLYYFESDQPVGVRGATIVGNGATGDIDDDPDGNSKYTICFYGTNQIFVNDSNFWRDTANFFDSSDNIYSDILPFQIIVSGAANSANNGTFTVTDVLSILDNEQITVTSSNSHQMDGNKVQAVLKIAETSLVSENVADGTSITFKQGGQVGDTALAVGNVDDGKVDVFFDSNGSWTADAITVLDSADGSSKPEFNYYYTGNALRVADGNFSNRSTPQWYGFIDRKHFQTQGGTANASYRHIINPAFYSADNNLIAPTSANYTASGSVDGNTEYPSTGAGWGLSVHEDTEIGEWMSGTYKFACSFVYDGNQESLLTEFDATQAIANDGVSIIINVYAKDDGSTHYPNRVTGGRIYIKESDTAEATATGEPYELLADIDITKGVRVSLDSEYQAWTTDGAGEFRVTSDVTEANRGTAYWRLKLKSPNLDTYETINGYSPQTKQISFGQTGSGYKTAVVAGRRTFVANVMYDDNKTSSDDNSPQIKHYGDRIMYSEVGKFDTFPSNNFIDVVLGDGEEYVKLAYFADRILAFKQRTLQVINISSPSPSGWFLEKTVPYAGTVYPYSVCECEAGVVWANRNGAYLFNGSTITNISENKIADTGSTVYTAKTWKQFSSNASIVVGYSPELKQALFTNSASTASDIFYYDFRYRSWYYGTSAAPLKSSSFTPLISNMITDSSGNLLVAYDTQSTNLDDAGTNKVVVTAYDNAENAHDNYFLLTKDFDFGAPGRTKKVYGITIHYRHSDSNAIDDGKILYQKDQDGTFTAFNNSLNAITQTHASQNNYNVLKLPIGSIVSCQSIMFKFNFASLTAATKFAINDIVIEYRVLQKEAG